MCLPLKIYILGLIIILSKYIRILSTMLDIVPFSHLVDHCSGIPNAGTEELLAESSRTSDKGNFSTSSSDATPTIIEDDVDSNEGNVSSGEIITLDIQEVTIL